MFKFRVNDVMWELAEFSRELLLETQQLLQYHRASAYKDETAKKIRLNIDQTRALFEILADDVLLEVLADIDAFDAWSGQGTSPGECLLTARTSHLIRESLPALELFQKRIMRNKGLLPENTIKAIAAKRRALLAVCRHGSRSWELLKNL